MSSPSFSALITVRSLEEIDISGELLSRRVSTPNRKQETAALYALAGALHHGSAPVLKRLSQLALTLCDAGSAGVSIIESTADGALFRWKALAGEVEKFEGGSTPREWSPCGACLQAGHATLYSYPARHFTYFEELEPPIVEGLVVPIVAASAPVGTIWVVSHSPSSRFDAEHVRIMTSLGSFAASALELEETSQSNLKRSDTARIADRTKEIVWGEYLRRITGRDERALESLMAETRALVFASALRIASFRADAEEIAADVYARVWMHAGDYDAPRGSVGAWLVKMTQSGAIDRLRARAVRLRTEAALISQCSSSAEPELSTMDASHTSARLARAIGGLPFDQRRVIELYYFSELPVTEIAARLSHPVGTVKTRLRLAIMKLRRLFAALEPAPAKRPPLRLPKTGPVYVNPESGSRETAPLAADSA